MNAGLMGKVLMGRASGDDVLEALGAMGMVMQNDALASEAVALVAAVEPVIRRGIEDGGQFRMVTLDSKKGRMTAFILIEQAVTT